ncbi:MAG: hypothetical protein ICV84_11840 [Flavisolibacter sp.]|nr:hypothetical protein [Flavisolibacter sp.]MBD0352720.1 hypothetical protein [Flavisolibacter sp.]
MLQQRQRNGFAYKAKVQKETYLIVQKCLDLPTLHSKQLLLLSLKVVPPLGKV